MDGHHHLHIRKRHSRPPEHTHKLEPYPARSSWKRALDKLMLAVGVAVPLASVPQILLIYGTRDASGVSPLTFLLLSIFNILWIIYALVHREPPLLLMSVLLLMAHILILIGALVYG